MHRSELLADHPMEIAFSVQAAKPEVSGTPGIALKCGRGALRAPVSRLNGTRAGAQESAPTALLRRPEGPVDSGRQRTSKPSRRCR